METSRREEKCIDSSSAGRACIFYCSSWRTICWLPVPPPAHTASRPVKHTETDRTVQHAPNVQFNTHRTTVKLAPTNSLKHTEQRELRSGLPHLMQERNSLALIWALSIYTNTDNVLGEKHTKCTNISNLTLNQSGRMANIHNYVGLILLYLQNMTTKIAT